MASVMQKVGKFLYPNKTTLAIFLLLLVITPVFYIYAEPERTNYLPGEEQQWMIKTKVYLRSLGISVEERIYGGIFMVPSQKHPHIFP